MGDSEFKIFLGVELEKNSKTTLDQEIKKLTENGIKLQIGLDKQSLTTLTTSIDNITKQLQSMGSMGSNATKDANKGFEQTAKKAKDYADGLSILTEQYKKGTLSAKEYFDEMNGRMLNKKGELNKYNNQLDPSKLQEYLTLLSNIQSRIGEIKPIGDLISSKTMSTISNGFTEVVQKVDTYTDRMGKVQSITSIVNKNTGELIASYEKVTNSSEKYETSIEKQKTTMEKLRASVSEIGKLNVSGIRQGFVNDDMINNYLKLKEEYNQINELSKTGVVIEQSKIEAIKRNILEQENLIKTKQKEIEATKKARLAQEEQVLTIQRLQNSFNNQNSKYSTGVNENDRQAMQDRIDKLGKLNPLQDNYKIKVQECQEALNQYNNKIRESASYAQQQEVALNKQIEAVQKLQSSFANTNSKYSTGVNAEESEKIKAMINALSEMNPLTSEYKHQLQMVGMALSEYSNKVKENATQTQKEEVALNNQIVTLDKLKNKLQNIKASTNGSYNKQEANNFSQEIEAISRLNPLTEEYRNRVQAINVAMTQFGVESKRAFAEAKNELTSYEQGFNRLIALFKMGEISDQQFLKSAQSIRYTTTATGELVEKQEYLNLTSQQQIQLANSVAKAQNRMTTETEKSAKAEQDLANYQRKMIFDLEQLKQVYSSKGMNTSGIDDLMNKVRGLTTNTANLKNEQTKLNESYRQMNIASRSMDTVGSKVKNILAMATGFYGMYSVFGYLRQGLSSVVKEVTSLDSAMIDLSRVTSETNETYNNFKSTMFDVADKIGGTATDLVKSATDFAKLGFSFEESGKLAQDASKYATAGWLSMQEATDSLTASYTVFSGKFDETIGKVVDSTTIIDLYNKIGNTMAVTSGDIGEAMKASANSLAMANNSMSESVALIATANKTVQDSSRVGKHNCQL